MYMYMNSFQNNSEIPLICFEINNAKMLKVPGTKSLNQSTCIIHHSSQSKTTNKERQPTSEKC